MTTKSIQTTAYLVLIPQHTYAGVLTGIRVDGVFQSRPKLNSRAVAVKLNISLETAIFEQVLPEADIKIVDRRQLMEPMVEVSDPTEPEPEPEVAE